METPKTTFEKLLFAISYIKFLKAENKDLTIKLNAAKHGIKPTEIRDVISSMKKQIEDLIIKSNNQKTKIKELTASLNKIKDHKPWLDRLEKEGMIN